MTAEFTKKRDEALAGMAVANFKEELTKLVTRHSGMSPNMVVLTSSGELPDGASEVFTIGLYILEEPKKKEEKAKK